MKALLYGFLLLAAAGLVGAIVIGVALKLVLFLLVMAAISGATLYIAGRIYGPPSHLPSETSELDHLKQ